MEQSDYLSPDQAAALIPGMTRGNLAQLRYAGTGPRFLKPTPRVVVYRRADVIEWLERNAFTRTR